MDATILPAFLFWAALLPIALGFTGSFWLAGKGNRLLWIVPSLILWYAGDALLGWIHHGKLTMVWIISEWLNAGLLIAGGYAFRRWRNRKRISTAS